MSDPETTMKTSIESSLPVISEMLARSDQAARRLHGKVVQSGIAIIHARNNTALFPIYSYFTATDEVRFALGGPNLSTELPLTKDPDQSVGWIINLPNLGSYPLTPTETIQTNDLILKPEPDPDLVYLGDDSFRLLTDTGTNTADKHRRIKLAIKALTTASEVPVTANLVK
jgi:hypothetical protein